MPNAEHVLVANELLATKKIVVVAERLNRKGASGRDAIAVGERVSNRDPPKPNSTLYRPAVASVVAVVVEILADRYVMVVVAPPEKLAIASTSQSPAVKLMDVMFFAVVLVSAVAEPDAITLSMYSPKFPAVALSLVAVPGYCPVVRVTEPATAGG